LSQRKTYEVGIYNEEVRQAEKDGTRHRDISMDWAETHYIEVQAGSEQEARIKVNARYPEARGYVIVDISESGF